MAVPKRKTSKSKRDKRRTHKKIKALTLAECSECGESTRPHHLCPSCGAYKGRVVLDAEEE